MNNAVLKIFIRVIERSLNEGGDLEEILNSYSNLSEEEKQIIKNNFSKFESGGITMFEKPLQWVSEK